MKWLYRSGICFYQRFISPKKGYRCPHSLETGGPGCSGAVLAILESKGLIAGYQDIAQRFADCSESAEKRRKREKKKESGGSGREDSCVPDPCSILECGAECGPKLPRLPKPDGDCIPDCGHGHDCTPGCDIGCSSITRHLFRIKR